MTERPVATTLAEVSAIVDPLIPRVVAPDQLSVFWEQVMLASEGLTCPRMKAFCMASTTRKIRFDMGRRPRTQRCNEDRMFEAYLIHEEVLKDKFSDSDSVDKEFKNWFKFHGCSYTMMDELD